MWNMNPYNPVSAAFQPPTNGITTVSSLEEAKAYILPPNSVSEPLFLPDKNEFVIKSTDGSGGATVSRFTFEEIKEEPAPDPSEYATKADLENLMNMVLEAIDGKRDTGQVQAE